MKITGTPPNPSGNTDIYDTTTWKDEHITLSGDCIIHPSGSLTLDHTTLLFASLETITYGITVKKGNETADGGRLRIINNSSVTPKNLEYNTFIYSEYSYPPSPKTPVIQASDSYFSKLGKGYYGGDDPKRYGLEMRHTTNESYFDNITITNSWNGICLGDGGEPIDITNCTFENINGSAIFIKYVGAYIYNNTITDMRFGVYAYETNNLRIIGNTFDAKNHLGNYVLDIMARDKNLTIKDNTIKNFQRGILLLGAQEDSIVENNTLIDGIGLGIAIGERHKNITILNNSITNTQDGISFDRGTDLLVQDNEIINPSHPTYHVAGLRIQGQQNTTVYNLIIHNINQTKTKGINIYNNSSNIKLENITLSGGFKYAIVLNNSSNILFTNTDIPDPSILYDVDFQGLTQNIRFINARFDESRVHLTDTTDILAPYYYLDVNVTDNQGNPLSGATVTIINEIDNNYPSINVSGEIKNNFITGTDGHTNLPSNETNSAAILAFWKSISEKMDMSYTIHVKYTDAEGNQHLDEVTGVAPNASWYREDPDVPVETITVTLPGIIPPPPKIPWWLLPLLPIVGWIWAKKIK